MPPDLVTLPPDQSRQTLVAVTLLTAEVKTNTSAMVELSKRIEKLETSLAGEGNEFGMKTNLALLAHQVKTIENKQQDQETWKKNFKSSLYIAILVWLLSIIYNILPFLHPRP